MLDVETDDALHTNKIVIAMFTSAVIANDIN